MIRLGVVGGSGLYELAGLKNVVSRRVETPFGDPSDEYVCGELDGRELVFLPRHGRGHRLLPAEIPFRANIFGFKVLGVDAVVSVSAVGSLREEMRPRDVVLPDQYFDRTKNSAAHTFFGGGVAGHVVFGEPTCPNLRAQVAAAARAALAAAGGDRRLFERGTYVNMEGPAFSTRAESEFYRRQGFDVIGMTSLAEAKLCREAELCYQAIALVTDYDCWHETAESVTVEMVIANLTANIALAKDVLARLAALLDAQPAACACRDSLKNAIMTAPDRIPADWKKKMAPLTGRYLGT